MKACTCWNPLKARIVNAIIVSSPFCLTVAFVFRSWSVLSSRISGMTPLLYWARGIKSAWFILTALVLTPSRNIWPFVRNHQPYLLVSSRTRAPLTSRRVEQIVETHLKAAGLGGRGYSPHKLRHTAATLMYQYGGVDIRVLKEILGHVNLGTTEIYTHVSNDQIANAADRNPLSHVKSKPSKKEAETE